MYRPVGRDVASSAAAIRENTEDGEEECTFAVTGKRRR